VGLLLNYTPASIQILKDYPNFLLLLLSFFGFFLLKQGTKLKHAKLD